MANPDDDALVRITFQIDNFLGLALYEKGKITRAGQAAENANKEIAQGIQKKQLENLIRSVEETARVQRPSQYLVRAVENEDFIAYSPEGFTVGTDTALNETRIMAYWRGVEFGSERFVGREIRGYFRGVEGGKYPARSDRVRMDPRLIQVGRGGGTKHGRFPFLIHIHNPIPEYSFLRRGIAAYDSAVIGSIYQRWFDTLN